MTGGVADRGREPSGRMRGAPRRETRRIPRLEIFFPFAAIAWPKAAIRLPLVFLLLAALVSPVWSEVRFQAKDLMVLPAEAVTVYVEVKRGGIPLLWGGLSNAEVRVRCPSLPAIEGELRTDRKGRIDIAFEAPAERGTHLARFECRGASLGLIIAVVPRDWPIIVTDIDHTIADIASHADLFLYGDPRSIRPMPGAAEALGRLSADYQVVYLTARPRELAKQTRAWLRYWGFPRGPLFMRNLRKQSLSGGEYKTEFLEELGGRWTALRAGMSEKMDDMEAYRSQGMTGFIIDPEGKASGSEGVVPVKSWAEIPARLDSGAKK